MKIEGFEVIGLLDRGQKLSAPFHEDINILTGRNGAGKTSTLKLLWYIISGNILLALREVPFQRATVITDKYKCTVFRLSSSTCKVEIEMDGDLRVFEDVEDGDGDTILNAEDLANDVLKEIGSSVFFPTFRRIEGGFTLGRKRSSLLLSSARSSGDIEEALSALSKKLSNEPHIFVSSISTVDIVSLLLRQYADLSQLSNELQQNISQEIIKTIKDFRSDSAESDQLSAANEVLDTIRSSIESMEKEREHTMSPFTAVQRLVEKLFKQSGIKIGARINFGDAANAVNSDSLSAGEKQLLSFVCYNAFYKDSIFIIDEPELSLHVDWQRQLFSILRSQHQSNQFIFATHSPFIYSKYPEKEITLVPDRGDEDFVLENPNPVGS